MDDKSVIDQFYIVW